MNANGSQKNARNSDRKAAQRQASAGATLSFSDRREPVNLAIMSKIRQAAFFPWPPAALAPGRARLATGLFRDRDGSTLRRPPLAPRGRSFTSGQGPPRRAEDVRPRPVRCRQARSWHYEPTRRRVGILYVGQIAWFRQPVDMIGALVCHSALGRAKPVGFLNSGAADARPDAVNPLIHHTLSRWHGNCFHYDRRMGRFAPFLRRLR